jgi:hypothetical protein
VRRRKHLMGLMAGVVLLGLVGEAGAAAEFSPEITFELLDKKASVNAQLRIAVKQDTGEEELKNVQLNVPAGFSLAIDQQLTDGETLAAGAIMIDAGPRCRGLAGSAPANVPVEVIERNRRSSEIASGAVAVYVVDLQPVTTIDLVVYGSSEKGWRLEGNIPPNDNTCPPLSLDVTFRQRAMTSNTPIITNPQYGGAYEFSATFNGLQGGVSTTKQSVIVEGAAKPGQTATKSCKGLKGKKKRRCRKKLQG